MALLWHLLFIPSLLDCAIVSIDGPQTQIFELNTTATLKWNLNGVVKADKNQYNVHYNQSSKDFMQLADNAETLNEELLKKGVVRFKDRVSGVLILNEGNGSLSVTLQNVEYEDSGNFSLNIFSYTNGNPPTVINEHVDITLDVQGL